MHKPLLFGGLLRHNVNKTVSITSSILKLDFINHITLNKSMSQMIALGVINDNNFLIIRAT